MLDKFFGIFTNFGKCCEIARVAQYDIDRARTMMQELQ